MIRAVIVDFGGVIIHIHYDRFFRTLARHSSLSPVALKKRYFSFLFANKLQCGKETLREVYNRLVREICLTMSYTQFERCWLTIPGKQISSTVRILHQLQKNYPLYVLSNMEAFVYPHIRKNIPPIFTRLFFSYEIGLAKPDMQAFRSVCRSIRCTPSECLFIDDLRLNVQAARAYGMQAIKYTQGIDLGARLRRFGVHI